MCVKTHVLPVYIHNVQINLKWNFYYKSIGYLPSLKTRHNKDTSDTSISIENKILGIIDTLDREPKDKVIRLLSMNLRSKDFLLFIRSV